MNTKKIVDFFFEIASLRRLTRSHRQVIETASDNISDHSFRVAVIGFMLAQMEGCDENKVLKMCLFHDVAEARTGDANYINKRYVQMNEKKARQDQMEPLPFGQVVLKILEEYEDRDSLESKVAKDADLLDQMILQQEYFYNDPENAKKWHANKINRLKSDSAKKIGQEILTSNPFNWIYELPELILD